MEVAVARRQAKASWLNGRTVLGVALFAVSLMAGQRMLAGADDMRTAWVAARDLPSETVLTPGDLEPIEVRIGGGAAAYPSSPASLEGHILTRPVAAGELIPSTSVTSSASGARAITVPVTPDHAVGGALSAGDKVDVFATFGSGDVRAQTSLLLRSAEVTDVVRTGAIGLSGADSIIGVTVLIDEGDAARVAFAIRTGEIDIVKVLGGGDSGSGEPVSAEDFG